jgi:hypothetical protein
MVIYPVPVPVSLSRPTPLPHSLSLRRFSTLIHPLYAPAVTKHNSAAPRLTQQLVIYLGASSAIRMFEDMRPAVLAMDIRSAVVNARAFRFGMLETIQALFRGDIGYAYALLSIGKVCWVIGGAGDDMIEMEWDCMERNNGRWGEME